MSKFLTFPRGIPVIMLIVKPGFSPPAQLVLHIDAPEKMDRRPLPDGRPA
jgi:hypothetical protein